jgi:hypothetical protein
MRGVNGRKRVIWRCRGLHMGSALFAVALTLTCILPMPSETQVAAAAESDQKGKAATASFLSNAGEAKHEIPKENLPILADFETCAKNLREVYAAIRKYEKEKNAVPDWLSDLVPDYLNGEALFCPDDPSHRSGYWPDPKLPCSYCYELSPSRVGAALGGTMRNYKVLQRGLFGDVVPVVRCFHHSRVLNLAWDGRIYTSAEWFENLFIPDYRHEMLFASEKPKIEPVDKPQPKPVEPAAEKAQVLALDDFDGKLGLKWEIVNSNSSNYSLTKETGTLTITTKKGHFSKSNTAYENVFLIECPAVEGQDFQITTCLSSFKPQACWNQAGILCWDDEDNYVKLVYEWAGRPAFTTGIEAGGRDHYLYSPADPALERIWLRITKRGALYRCLTSLDGKSFEVQGEVPWVDRTPKRVGVFANNGSFWPEPTPVPDLDASFEFFEVATVPTEPPEEAQAGPKFEVNYETDLGAFLQEMDRTYPFFELKGIRKDWEATSNRLREEVKECKSDGDFLGIVLQAIRCLRDGHMGFRDTKASLPPRPPRYYPGISFLPATNERVVIMSAGTDLDPDLKIGTIVTKIDGEDARQDLEDRAGTAWAEGGHFSSPQRARLYEFRIPLRGEKGEKHTITFLADGKEREVEVTSNIEARGWPHWYNRPGNLKQVGSCSYTRLPSGVGYIYLRRIDRSTGPGLKEAFSTHPDARGWIIDLRGNGGGGYDQALFDALRSLPRPLAILIDAGCFSAGETLARDFVRYGNARLFGSKTAGSSGRKRTWTFPSGIASVSVAVRSHGGIAGRPIEFNGIEPDVKVEALPEEIARGLNSAICRAEEYLIKDRGGSPASDDSPGAPAEESTKPEPAGKVDADKARISVRRTPCLA